MSKLSDTQFIILSNAVRREDGIIELPDHLRRGAAAKVIKRLLANSLIEEVAAKPDMPVWRRDENEGCPYALVVTNAGRLAINAVRVGEKYGGNPAQSEDNDDEAKPRAAASNRKAENPAARPQNRRAGQGNSKKKNVLRHQTKSRSKQKNVLRHQTKSRSKQDEVIAMLGAPAGATITAIMKATGWQQHSVRGFFAGVVRKKLKLKLTSQKTDGGRIYRITTGGAQRATSRRG